MTETIEQPPPEPILQQGYEPDVVSNRGLLIFFAIFILTALILHWSLWKLVNYYVSLQRPIDTITSAAPAQKRFPAPNLQPSQNHNTLPYQDLEDMKQQEAEFFRTIGWPASSISGEPSVPANVAEQLQRQRAQVSGQNGGGR